MIGIRNYIILAILASGSTLPLYGQSVASWKSQPVDVAFTFDAERTQYTTGADLWLYGGSGEVAFNLGHKLGLVVNATGSTTQGSNGNQSFSRIMTTAGPRFTVPLGQSHSRFFVEGLAGSAHGFNSVFPSSTNPVSSATSLAIQAGGGFDLGLGHTLSLRLIDAHYIRTTLPNGFKNLQQDLLLGAGIVWRPIDRSAH
jgi:hypothetical protein